MVEVIDFVYPRNKTHLIKVSSEDKKYIESINFTSAKQFFKQDSLRKIKSLVPEDFESLDSVLKSRTGVGGVSFSVNDNYLIGFSVSLCHGVDFSELKAKKLEWLQVWDTYKKCTSIILPETVNVPNLKNLTIWNADYGSIQEPLFKDYKQLTYLTLHKTSANELPDLELKDLVELNIQGNPLKKIPALKTPKLRVLKVDPDNLEEKTDLTHLKQLKLIYLNYHLSPVGSYMIKAPNKCLKIEDYNDYLKYIWEPKWGQNRLK